MQAGAYAPLLQALAERGFLGVLVPMPFNLAVLNMNGADGVQEQFPEVRSWVLMGHSLGGAMAAAYASSHGEEWEGLGLLGAYATSDLAESGLTVLSLSGTEDGILNRQAAASQPGQPAGGRRGAQHRGRQPCPVRLLRGPVRRWDGDDRTRGAAPGRR